MDPTWDTTWALFHQAIEMDADARAPWLAQLALSNPVQAAELQALLAAHARDDAMLDRPLIAEDSLSTPAPGERVGAYVLLREIGRGGMGTVFEAARDDGEYRHRVALKLVAPERMQPGILARFRRERQIMAGLEHPHIARLLDGGSTRHGRPFLVMEFIDGEPIDRWCARRAMVVADRLQLVERIAEAVDYAHRHLVVHRDIKPGNVLVDGQGRAVLLDFGIAKLLEPDAESSDATQQIGARAMTPRYSSPEQLRGEPVSTATDVYALGVLLYELIAGAPPYEDQRQSPERLAERIELGTPPGLAQTRRRHLQHLREVDADAHAAEIALLESEILAPELDWIVRKAMAARADQRYPSALALADDLRRLRQHQPIEARAASLAYRMRKSVRRHRFGYAFAALFVLMASIFGVRLAVESQRTRAALAASQKERVHADNAATFLVALFELADRTQNEGRDVSAREILDRGRERLAAQQDLAPAVRARLLGSLARVYRNLGAYPIALQLLDEAGPLIDAGSESLPRAQWLRDRGSVLELQGANAAARDALQQSLHLFESLGAAYALDSARTAKLLAITLQSLGERAAAGRMFRRADQDLNAIAGSSIDDRADSALRLGSWFWIAGDFNATADYYARALALRRSERPLDLSELARTLDGNGALAHAQGRYDQAVIHFEEALALRRQVLGSAHRLTADTLSNFGATRFDQGQLDAALNLLNEAIAVYEQVLPRDSPVLAKTLNNLGLVRHQQGDYPAARDLFERALGIHRRALGDQHPKLAANLNNLGLVEEQTGHIDSAQKRFREALHIQEQALGVDHVSIGFTLTNLGRMALWTDDRPAALELLERASTLRRGLPDAHPLRADTASWLGLAYCLDPGERGRGRTLIAANLQQHSPAQALERVELEALLAICEGHADVADHPDWRRRVAAVVQLRGADHPLSRFLLRWPGASARR
jgi:serine/threonine protein kinase/Tfp pilus assembly protein PilF